MYQAPFTPIILSRTHGWMEGYELSQTLAPTRPQEASSSASNRALRLGRRAMTTGCKQAVGRCRGEQAAQQAGWQKVSVL